jgi:hypothetical protein
MEQRAHPRSPHKEYLKICMYSRLHYDTLFAISSDSSDSGACIYTFKPLKEGEELLLKINLPVPYHKATVWWVKQCNRLIYRAGILFAK